MAQVKYYRIFFLSFSKKSKWMLFFLYYYKDFQFCSVRVQNVDIILHFNFTFLTQKPDSGDSGTVNCIISS